jgi:two-component system C4-dicarboxylate transport response regulator DctD
MTTDHNDVMKKILLVDDEKAMRQSIRQWLELAGFEVEDFDRAHKALDRLTPIFPGAVISDIKMPEMDGLAFNKAAASIDPDIPMILITAHGDVATAVQAMREGVYDLIEKPFDPERIIDVLRRALEKRALVLENRDLKRTRTALAGLDARLVGSSKAMLALKQEIIDIAASEAAVMLIGETGTGKELVARCIHDLSGYRNGPFCAVNCAAIPAQMAESELFGHERGAFTGADRQRIGRLEAAQGGTVLLDEITSMPMEMQGKLLRAIQEKEIIRVGSNITIPVAIRLISATNEDPLNAIRQGRLREDLYYRLNTVELRMPVLRDRKEDIALLFSLFLERAAETYDREIVPLAPQVHMALMGHRWPGNVRELKNAAERYVLFSTNAGERLLRSLSRQDENESSSDTTLAEQVRLFERQIIKDTLKRQKGNMKAVMSELDLPRRTLNEKMTKYGLSRDDCFDEE